MHHGLGEPLPHQLANAPRVHPSAEACASFPLQTMRFEDLCGFSIRFRMLSPSDGQVTHVLLTRPPLDNLSSGRSFPISISFDLHVLGTPPAFILSQDRTLIKSAFLAKSIIRSSERFKFSPSQNALSLFFLFTVKVCFRCTFLCF